MMHKSIVLVFLSLMLLSTDWRTATQANAQTEAETEAPAKPKPKPAAKPKPVPKPAPKSNSNGKADKAKPADVDTQKFGSWVVSCPTAGDKSGARCFARLTVIDEKRKVVLINWLIGYNKDQQLLMDVLTPTEVDIAYGLNLTLDKSKPLKLPYISCGLKGCISRTLIDQPTFENLRKAKLATISILSTNNKEVKMKIEPVGLPDAMAAISIRR